MAAWPPGGCMVGLGFPVSRDGPLKCGQLFQLFSFHSRTSLQGVCEFRLVFPPSSKQACIKEKQSHVCLSNTDKSFVQKFCIIHFRAKWIFENLSNIFGLSVFFIPMEYVGFTVRGGSGSLQRDLSCIMVSVISYPT